MSMRNEDLVFNNLVFCVRSYRGQFFHMYPVDCRHPYFIYIVRMQNILNSGEVVDHYIDIQRLVVCLGKIKLTNTL